MKRGVTGRRALREVLREGRLERIVELAGESRRVLATLFALTYDPDPTIAWRAIEGMGLAAARISEDDPDFVRDQLRRLHWLLCEESGGIGWRAPEAMAEIVSRRPDTFGDYVPIVAHLILETAEEDLQHFRPGMVWAIGRLGRLVAEDSGIAAALGSALVHPDAQVRGVAVWAHGRLGWLDPLRQHDELHADDGRVKLYEDGTLRTTSVADLVATALDEREGG